MRFKFRRLRSSRRERPVAAPRIYHGRLRFYLAGLLVLAMAFIVSLYAFFPLMPLRERIERDVSREIQADLRIGRLALLFPPGIRAKEVILDGIEIPGRESVELTALEFRPLWLSLFGANPGLSFQAELMGGQAEGEAWENGALKVQASRISFAQPVGGGSNLGVSGVLREGVFSGSFPLEAGTDTRLEAMVEQLRLTGLESLGVSGGVLTLGNLSLQGSGKGRTFKIDRLESTGGDLQVSGAGSLLLNQSAARSRINLVLTLRPGPNFDSSLRDLLELFASPGADGSYRMRLNGSLASPIFAK